MKGGKKILVQFFFFWKNETKIAEDHVAQSEQSCPRALRKVSIKDFHDSSGIEQQGGDHLHLNDYLDHVMS